MGKPIAKTGSGLAAARADRIRVALFSVLLFLTMTLQTGRMTMAVMVLAFLCLLGRSPLRRLQGYFCVPVLGLVFFALMQGLGAIYGPFDESAAQEYIKFACAFSLCVIALCRFEGRHVRGLLWGMGVVCAAIAVLCVDAACDGVIFRLFNGLIEMLGGTFSNLQQNAANERVAGIYNDSNISASILGLGALICLYLSRKAKKMKELLAANLLLGLCSMGFFLSMSRGAILAFGVTLLVWLIAAEKGDRLSLFLHMVMCIVVVILLSFPAIQSIIGGASAAALVLMAACGGVLFALHRFVLQPASAFFDRHLKIAAAAVAGIAAVGVLYGMLAFCITSDFTFDQEAFLQRSIGTLSPGTYTVEVDADEGMQLEVRFQTPLQRTRGQSDCVYQGPAQTGTFVVPEEEGTLFVRLLGAPGQTVRALSVAGEKEIPLQYPLLPAFVANRLQEGLFGGNSMVTRIQFVVDAWAIFIRSPLIGHGLGSTEGLYTAVQPYYYESLFAHNHLMQVLCDTGILGFAGFAALLAGALYLLLRALRGEERGLAALLLACWVMINVHSVMEINFSIRAYQCLAYLLLLFPVLLFAKPLCKEGAKKACKRCGVGLYAVCAAYLVVFGILLESHRSVSRNLAQFSTSDAHVFLNVLEQSIRQDVFVREHLMLSYVSTAVAVDEEPYTAKAHRYAEQLRSRGTYAACSDLARYYYLPYEQWEAVFAASRDGIRQKASDVNAWNYQMDFYRKEVLPAMGQEHLAAFMIGVGQTVSELAAFNDGRMEPIPLTPENQTFLMALNRVQTENLSDEIAFGLLMQEANPLGTLS